MRFDGKVVLVTGAEQGIGRALALGFASHGASVAINYPAAPDKAEAVRAAAAAHGVRAIAAPADVRYADQVARMVAEVERQLGRIDVLVNNAGIYPRAYVVDMDEQTWDDVLGVNLKGTFLCCRAVAPGMIARRYGRIVTIASTMSFMGRARGAHYGASKAGLLGFTRSFALEVAPYGITVNCIAPGTTNTAQPRYGMTEEELAEVARQHPMGRIAEPEDMVGPALFLASDYAAYVSGQVLPVNGGAYFH
ncbi:MAG: 3-oxoacyl-ACP reductase FabG [Chloroflexi bacterium]|nr:3-oxoacyl-ACP reductase FabG [Chloroflexota bacterium]